MNEQEIDSMPAGTNLDASVAEMVFGLTVTRGKSESWHTNDTVHISRNGRVVDALPFFSSDIRDAWRVVELFRDGFANYQVAAVIEMRVLDTVEPDDCECRIYSPTLSPVYAKAREMPLAICRAALKAALKAERLKNRF